MRVQELLVHADGESHDEPSSTDSEDETSCECKHSMDIMYDRQMSVTIAEFIGGIMKKEAEKLAHSGGRAADLGASSADGEASERRSEMSRAASSDSRREGAVGGILGKPRRKGSGVRFSDDSFRDRNGKE